MKEAEKRLKVYCETSFWSYLNGGSTTLAHIAVKQAVTRQWWEEIAPSCDIYVSQYVENEISAGNPRFAELREDSMKAALRINGKTVEVDELAKLLTKGHAIPENEATDSLHIATAAVYGMDVLLTWNCKHMANMVTLPATASIVANAGYRCPVIVTPEVFMAQKEEFGL